MNQRLTIQDIVDRKKDQQKITMLTAYDYPLAGLVDAADIDIVLVGDSLANVVLGLESTPEVGMDEMLHHAKAASRAIEHAVLIGDMPYESYQKDISASVSNAKRFVNEANCQAVKLEWFDQCVEVAKSIVDEGIPVMGHVGLTPQTAEEFKVQGRNAQAASEIIDHAKALEDSGCFSVVLECIPSPLAKIITESLRIPTIGIGAGVHCDGQVLVTHDLLGLFDRYKPKFAKQYINLAPIILEQFKAFKEDVQRGSFPSEKESYQMKEEEIEKLRICDGT